MKKVFGWLLVFGLLGLAISEYCTSSDCQSERSQSIFEREAERAAHKEEITKYKQLLAQSNCSICNVNGINPCNNGTCDPTGNYTYVCECPDNTSGDHCQNLLICEDGDCGVDAICTVFNHKKVCSCPAGTTGNPQVSCSVKTYRACFWGDPHYTTFDGTVYHYQGTCPMDIITLCNSTVDWSITGTNTFWPANHDVSVLNNFTFSTQAHKFTIDQNLNLIVDGLQAYYPYYWPSATNATVIIIKPSNQIIIQDIVNEALITFLPYQLCVTLPHSDLFYGTGKVCGVFGDVDGNCKNDIRARNGSVYNLATCNAQYNLGLIEYEDTWITQNINNCVKGANIQNNPSCAGTTSEAQLKCALIKNATEGVGPFGACEAMNTTEQYFDGCVYDVCHGSSQCGALAEFAQACIDDLPFVDIDNWRTPTFCPYKCPPHSHYSLKTPKCQNSCADHNYSNSSLCHDAYEEGCICDFGYYYDSNGAPDGYEFACRLLSDCGCMGTDGHYYPPNEHWLNATCTLETTCSNGTLTSQPFACSGDGECLNINGNPTCQCLPGYQGDGVNCTDIDECQLDPTLCSANLGHGTCNNLPGTYDCTCFAPYTGDQCTDYQPKRHCADLYVFNNVNTDGAYNVSIGANYGAGVTDDHLTWTTVYCDMTSQLGGFKGGWTLMGHGNNTNGKNFSHYVTGFGDPETTNVWLGLENIHTMTQAVPTSLRMVVESCPEDYDGIDDCAYVQFSIGDSTTQYALSIEGNCVGSMYAHGTRDAWVSWNATNVQPKFINWDIEVAPSSCSKNSGNTGWWFYHAGSNLPCGRANLNGVRINCDSEDSQDPLSVLTWATYVEKDAHMYLRPRDYPNYDTSGYTTVTSEPLTASTDY